MRRPGAATIRPRAFVERQMALIQATVERVDIPHEPGQWFEFRRLSAAQTRERKLLSLAALTVALSEAATLEEREAAEAARVGLALDWTRACVVGWSYETPFSLEAIELLDMTTLVWACVTAFQRTYGLESVAEKNGDSPGSTASSTRTLAPSVPTSG